MDDIHSSVIQLAKEVIDLQSPKKERKEKTDSSDDEENEFGWNPDQSEDENAEIEEEQAVEQLSIDSEKERSDDKRNKDEIDPIEDSSMDETPLRIPRMRLTTKLRIPRGWSQRPKESNTHGMQPKCKGCNHPIGRQKKCLRNRYFKRPGDKYLETDQYHCKVACLQAADRQELKKLTKKPFTDKRVAKVVKQLDKKMGLSE
jgi:hypothetical protein